MNKDKLNHFKKILLENRDEVLEDLSLTSDSFTEASKDNTGDLVDKAAKFYEKELSIQISKTEKETLSAIDKALYKIENNTFGYCESCNMKIDDNRLEAIPYAILCMDCKLGKRKGMSTNTKDSFNKSA